MILSDRVLFESSVIGSSKGSSKIDSSLGFLVFFSDMPVLAKNRRTKLIAKKKLKNTCIIEVQSIILEIYVINVPAYE